MQRIKKVDYDVDKFISANQYLFEDEGLDGSFIDFGLKNPKDDAYTEETQIYNFKNEIRKTWGAQESQLRTAIYVSFVKDTDTNLLRKKVKQRRSTFRKSTTVLEQS